LVIIVLSLISLFLNAPLEEIANPDHTPNPAKAPWYFLGLQELLHYFPPVVAGVLIPALVIVALVVIPYFGVNIKPRSIASLPSGRLKFWTTLAAVGVCGLMLSFGCWPLISVTLITWLAILWGVVGRGSLARACGRLRIPDWIMIWFVAAACILTIIGTFFRGPGWSWVWPWSGGIY
jgi:hypothetical protein